MPGSTPATSQLDWLISTTAMIVLSWSKATRDLLKSLGWGIRALHQLGTATMVPSPRRLPHTISPLEGEGFEPSVPAREITLRDCLLIEEVRFAADLYGAFPVKRLFCGFAQSSLFGAGKAVLRPVACDQVPGARGRGQGTETLAELGGVPP